MPSEKTNYYDDGFEIGTAIAEEARAICEMVGVHSVMRTTLVFKDESRDETNLHDFMKSLETIAGTTDVYFENSDQLDRFDCGLFDALDSKDALEDRTVEI